MIKKRLIGLLAHAKKYVAINIFWQIVMLLDQVTIVFTLTSVLGKAVERTFVINDLYVACIIFIGCIILRFIAEKIATKATYRASADVKRILRQKIYEKMLRLGLSYREQVATSTVVQMSTEGVEQLEVYFGKYLAQFFYSLIAPFILFIIFAPISLKTSLVLLICVPLIPMSIVIVQKIAKKLLSKYWSIYTGLGDSFLENLQGLTTLKIYQADEDKTQKMDEEAENFRKITMKVLTMQLNSISVMDIVAYGGAAVGMFVATNEFMAGNINFTNTLRIILLAADFFIPLRLLGSFFHIAMNGMAASDKIFAILDLPEKPHGTESIDGLSLDIKVQHLDFAYNTDQTILKDINLDIVQGQFVSLVGTSGSGKSTIANLLTGKLSQYTGEITIGGKNLREIDEASLMRNIVLVTHDSYLFKGTVRQNLLMGKPDASEEKMNDVLEQVNLLGFLNAQNGLDTLLLEKASNLSGGQQQRLAIARALLKDAPIYIFDEATSNIDIESETLIMNVVHELAKTKTVILISHRLANVVESDKIYFLKDSKIIEEGNHQSLVQLNDNYAKLFNYQTQLENYGKEDASCK